LTSPNPRLSKLAIELGHSGQVNFPTAYRLWLLDDLVNAQPGWLPVWLDVLERRRQAAHGRIQFRGCEDLFFGYGIRHALIRFLGGLPRSSYRRLGLQASFEPTDGIIRTYSGTQKFSMRTDSFASGWIA